MFTILQKDQKGHVSKYECKTLAAAINHFLFLVYRLSYKEYTITFSRKSER